MRSSGLKQHEPAAGDNGKFIELDVLEMAVSNGTIKGILTQRRSNGAITFSIVRTFDRDGIADWTSYFSEAQIEDFRKMTEMIEKRIKELRKDPKVMPLRSPTAKG